MWPLKSRASRVPLVWPPYALHCPCTALPCLPRSGHGSSAAPKAIAAEAS